MDRVDKIFDEAMWDIREIIDEKIERIDALEDIDADRREQLRVKETKIEKLQEQIKMLKTKEDNNEQRL